VRFYYPDLSVVCRPNPQTDSFQDEPLVIAEVLSRGTRRIDQGEKKDAYLTIPQLCAYLLIEQETPLIIVHRRTDSGFAPEMYSDLKRVIPFPEIGTEVPLSEIYDAVEFTPEEENSQ
jgi:Uma2 family endonuclease